jgi:hypothetical protein
MMNVRLLQSLRSFAMTVASGEKSASAVEILAMTAQIKKGARSVQVEGDLRLGSAMARIALILAGRHVD